MNTSFQNGSHFEWLATRAAACWRGHALHGASFVMALLLMAAGHEQLVTHPLWTGAILALFGCGYATASAVLEDAFYVYPTLALWTFAFFQSCYAAGLPPLIFPPLATVLIWVLWASAGNRRRAEPFNTALYRGVFLATLFFGFWSVFVYDGHLAVPATTFLLYGLSLAWFHGRRPRTLYACSAATYLAIGAFYVAAGSEMLMPGQTGPAVQVMVVLILLLGVLEHARGRFAAAKPYYVIGTALTAVCLLLALVGGRFLLDQFAVMAVTLGAPVLLFRGQAAGKRRDSLPSGEEGWITGLYMTSQAALYCGGILVIVAPLVALGHALWASLLLAMLSALAVVLRTPARAGTARNLHAAAFFTAMSLAWLVGVVRGRSGPAVEGMVVAFALWIAVWLIVRRSAARQQLAAQAAEGQAAIAAALVCVAVCVQAWHATVCMAAVMGLACGGIVWVVEKGRTGWLAASACAAVLLAAVTGMGLAPFSQWLVLEVAACVCLAVVCTMDSRSRPADVCATAALVLALCGASLALTFPDRASSVLCLAGSLGVLFALGGSFYCWKARAALAALTVINAAGACVLLWDARLVSINCLGTAILWLVPFLVVGWFTSRLWPYAGCVAATFALGTLLVIGGATGINWVFMLMAALICALLLRVRRGRDSLDGAAMAAVGHAVALVVVAALYRRSAAVLDWRVVPALVVAGWAYFSCAGSVRSGRMLAWGFGSLAALPLSAAVLGPDSIHLLVVPGVLVPAWAIMGFALRDRDAGVDACRTSALLGVLLGLMASFRAPDCNGLLFVLILAGLLLCLLVRRERVYVYLMLLALALMGFGWIRRFGTHFTLELYTYLLCVFGLATLVELSPYLIGCFDRVVPLPFVRLFTRRGLGFGALAGLLVALVCLLGLGVAGTEHPAFCKSCHFMDTYYDAWEHSSHREVACIECHYEPGFRAHVVGKLSAISEVAAYLTDRYDPKPHGEVSNASCQRPGCHVDMDLNESVPYDKGITFNHRLHDTTMGADRHLPCITCHSEEVKGEHLRITSSVCFLCHFHGDGPAVRRTADCRTCHDAPAGDVRMGESTFNHEDFFHERKGVDCHFCHMPVNSGDASVSSIRCRTCHYGDKLSDVDLGAIDRLHDEHVFEKKANCFECHGILRHGNHARASLDDPRHCADCHVVAEQHTLQARVYMGTAVPDLPGDPNVMYEAGISCKHCHVRTVRMAREGREFVTRIATPEFCASCHGDDEYAELDKMWQQDAREAIEALADSLAEALGEVEAALAAGTATAEAARSRLARAEALYRVVKNDGSFGVHNTSYVDEIIAEARKEIKATRQALAPGRTKP